MAKNSAQVAGKPYKKFIENQNKIMKTWILPVDGTMFRVVLEKDTLDIWVNGSKVPVLVLTVVVLFPPAAVYSQVEMAGEFTDDGTETHFAIGSQPAYVKAVRHGEWPQRYQRALYIKPPVSFQVSSGNKRSGLLHSLVVHDTEVPEFLE